MKTLINSTMSVPVDRLEAAEGETAAGKNNNDDNLLGIAFSSTEWLVNL